MRYLFGPFALGSTKVIKWANRWPFKPKKDAQPDVIVDVFIPFQNMDRFWDWYLEVFDYYPLWIVPYKIGDMYPWVEPELVKDIKDPLFIDCAIYGFPQKDGRNYYKELEDIVYELKGIEYQSIEKVLDSDIITIHLSKNKETEGILNKEKLDKIDQERVGIFGESKNTLLKSEALITENSCIPRDIVQVGNKVILGYNVHIGLKTQTKLSDIFAIYEYTDDTFKLCDYLDIEDSKFVAEFKDLFKYYKKSFFSKFHEKDGFIYMVFQDLVPQPMKSPKVFAKVEDILPGLYVWQDQQGRHFPLRSLIEPPSGITSVQRILRIIDMVLQNRHTNLLRIIGVMLL